MLEAMFDEQDENNKLKQEIEKLKAEREWISVKDNLPECWSQHGKSFATGCLLTFNKYGEYEINQYWEHGEHTSKGWIKSGESWDESNGDVTHWMSLPEPPK